MPRPKSKSELLESSQLNFDKLIELVNKCVTDDVPNEFPEGTLNRNISDVLMHLHHWHLMMMTWYEVGMSGNKPEMPATGYTWKTLPDLNKSIWEKYRNTPTAKGIQTVRSSYNLVREKIEAHTDEELFEKKRYKWTGTTSLGAYFISATSSHYDWAFKLFKKAIKNT